MNKREIIQICRLIGISPNKGLGQSFICNDAVIDRIVMAANIGKEDNVLEIGPGLGILTERLLENSNFVYAVEIDSGLVGYLGELFKNSSRIKIIHADFLKIRLDGNITKVVSNLPYYCASEILFKTAIDYDIKDNYIMIQKEMADRLLSKPGSRNYGAFTVSLGFYYDIEALFDIDRASFYPRPDVKSSFIRLSRKEKLPLEGEELKMFHGIVKSAFWGRRKTVYRALVESPHIELESDLVKKVLMELNLDTRLRGETLSLEQFIEMAGAFYRYIGVDALTPNPTFSGRG